MSELTTQSLVSRRALCIGILAVLSAPAGVRATSFKVLVHKDPNCGCCSGWVKHLEAAGFSVKIEDTNDLASIRNRLGVPAGLNACHTAEIEGYIVEGHAPVAAIRKLLEERPTAVGIAVHGMPAGSPGMGGNPRQYSVVLFGPDFQRAYMEFLGNEQIG
ncbi:DUF411 domain-containing protein [Bradyrhizobium sp.]|jgi:hypothetical protein|uniref:DUF411 domain-containing protein n=1 Tax=Bradyrhizobium sp. TaxID=376 RepID=UPI00391E00F8